MGSRPRQYSVLLIYIAMGLSMRNVLVLVAVNVFEAGFQAAKQRQWLSAMFILSSDERALIGFS